MNLHEIIERIHYSYDYNDPLFMSDGRVISKDADFAKELQLLLPLNVIKDGCTAAEFYLCRVEVEKIMEETKKFLSLVARAYYLNAKEEISFDFNGGVLCSDSEFTQKLTKMIPVGIIAKGYEAVINFSLEKLAKLRELYKFIEAEKVAA